MPQSDELTILKSQFVEYFEEIRSEGEVFAEIPTTEGLVDFLAEIEILDNGTTLHIKDVAIYPKTYKNLKGLALKEMLILKTELMNAAYQLGFGALKITGKRHEESTSANPGRMVDIFIDLRARFERR